MSELMKIVAEAKQEGIEKGQYKCQYCGQGFVRETTLAAHQCEPKRRAQQKTEIGVQLGYQAWIRFYEITQGSAKTKTYEDFAKNQFYRAFVKFGRHCHSISAINSAQFIDHVIRSNIKIDHWCHDKHYEHYLFELLRREAAQDALDRGVKHMLDWSEETGDEWNDYFRTVSNGRLVSNIMNGRISPWLLYCCDNGADALGRLQDWEVTKVWPWIDPDFWQKRLRDYAADTELAKHVLKEAGL